MNAKEWRRKIYRGLAHSLRCELDNGSRWLCCEDDGETPLSEGERGRMLAAVNFISGKLESLADGNGGKQPTRHNFRRRAVN